MRLFFALALLLAPVLAYSHPVVIINNISPAVDVSQRLTGASPADGESLREPPSKVTLTFMQPVRADKSLIRVTDSYGTKRSEDAVAVNGTTASVVLQPLAPGRYSVKWRARCQCENDTEIEGWYHFTVLPPQ